MLTLEGQKIDRNKVLGEYPTPQFRRDSFLSLNGEWDFAIDQDENNHLVYGLKILVPFAVETSLSGVERSVNKGDWLHYRKTFVLPEGFNNKGRVLLHFEAVDQICNVYLNGVKVTHHEGGYQPFTVDLLELKRGTNVLCVDVQDDTDSPIFPKGKQRNKRGGIWYTPTSGIWGSVWLESVPKQVIQKLDITPDFDEQKVKVAVTFEGKMEHSRLVASSLGKVVAEGTFDEQGVCELSVRGHLRPWTPESPALYDLSVEVNDDKVESYFAMRKFSTVEHNGFRVFALNNKPLFLSGVLDQGYYPDGGLTAPSEKAMADDIQLMKSMGFNMIRKHIKIEPMRWYYLCDKLGMIVIQDMVSSGEPLPLRYFLFRPFIPFSVKDGAPYKKLRRTDGAGRMMFVDEAKKTIARLYNCPCIAAWTIFNEGWGQFDSVPITAELQKLDKTRLFDATSGWFDTGCGDFSSHHVYFKKVRLHNDGKRVLSLSEFGGYSHKVDLHTFGDKAFGYKKIKTPKELQNKLRLLYEKQVKPLIEKEGLSVAVLTQLSDVEDEINGLVTYDRKKVKVDLATMMSINKELTFK